MHYYGSGWYTAHTLYQPYNVSVLVVVRMRFSLYLKAYACRQEFREFKGCIPCQCRTLIHSRKFVKPFAKLRCNQLKGISFYFSSSPTKVPKKYLIRAQIYPHSGRYPVSMGMQWKPRKKLRAQLLNKQTRKKIGNENCIWSWCAMCIAYLHLLWNMLFSAALFFFLFSRLFVVSSHQQQQQSVVRPEYVTTHEMQLINIHRCIADIYTTQTWHSHSLCSPSLCLKLSPDPILCRHLAHPMRSPVFPFFGSRSFS